MQYQYVANGNKFVFTLNVPGATNATWRFDNDNTVLPNGEFALPANWSCKDRTVTVYYYDPATTSWKVCCRKINICPPTNCESTIQYTYDGASNKFQFTLNVPGATGTTWRFDNDGTVLPNGMFVIPANWTCTDRTVTVYYFDPSAQTWRVCCRRIYICPPTNCQSSISFAYNAGGNAVTFTFNGGTILANVNWQVEETGQQLGANSNTSAPLLVPSPCAERTVSFRYQENGIWYICCKRVYLCNPYDCSSNITHSVSGNTLNISVNNSFTDVTWKNGTTGQTLGSGNAITYSLNNGAGNVSVCATYKDGTGTYRTCCKDISVSCPAPVAAFTFALAGSGVNFTNTSSGATSYSWNFNGGTPVAGSTTTSTNPTVVYASGNYNVCLTAINACGSKTVCQSVLMNSPTDCVFDIADDVCGGTGQEVLVPVTVQKFVDVLTFNFTIRVQDTTFATVVGIEQFNSTIQAGNNSFIQPDHVRFFWSDAIGKSLPDNTNIFYIRIKIKATTSGSTSLVFSDNPVKTEAYGTNLQLLALQKLPGSVCANATANVGGKVETPEGASPVAQAMLRITGNATNSSQMTGNDGLFTLGNLTSGGNYTLKPEKNIQPLNGINALDIVRLQRHLLQIDPLGTPYKLIAADVNNDRVVNALDVVILQRLQLRILDTFPNNKSWRFVPKSYTFTTTSPLTENFPEQLVFNPLNTDQMASDFYGIKIGDLNNTASANSITDGETPASRGGQMVPDTVKVFVAAAYGLQNQTVSVPVKCRKFNGVVAFEGSFKWDTLALQYVGTSGYGLPGDRKSVV